MDKNNKDKKKKKSLSEILMDPKEAIIMLYITIFSRIILSMDIVAHIPELRGTDADDLTLMAVLGVTPLTLPFFVLWFLNIFFFIVIIYDVIEFIRKEF